MSGLIKILILVCALNGGNTHAQSGPEPDIALRDIHEAQRTALRDRLATSLMFRGELADKIIDAGLAREVVALPEDAVYSAARLALLDWIKNNPDKAARLALDLKNGIKLSRDPVNYQLTSWEINPGFLEKIKALSAAAKDSGFSPEALEMVTKRLYEGSPGELDEGAVVGGGQRAGGDEFFQKNYADYRLNRGGLEREIAGAGRVLQAMRGSASGTVPGTEKVYNGAVARYGAFIVAAAAVKGRNAITAAESRAFEAHRAGLRRALAGLILRGRSAELRAIAEKLAQGAARPGGAALAAAARALAAGFETSAAKAEDGLYAVKDLGALIGRAERDFALLYVQYSVYSGLLQLKNQSQELGFSCLYDYLLWRWLVWFAPETAYVKVRETIKSSAAGLDAGLLKAGAGEVSVALEGPGGRARELGAALAEAGRASAANRRAQFFLWGVLFRPFEIEVYAREGKPFFWPALTFYGVTARRHN